MLLNSSNIHNSKRIKAVGLISGGLDSSLAAKIVTDMGIEVHGIYFTHPWGCCHKEAAFEMAERLGIKFVPLQLDERYLELIKHPKHGYGTALNPCGDCRIHMFRRAGQYMQSIGADFVFTGEVIGQRPMSQLRHRMRLIEKESGLEGRLLRPLCAHHFESTEPEKAGLVDRSRLLNLSGRSRKEQMELARSFGIDEYPAPAGGCLLTDQNFSRRMNDTLEYGYRNFRETIALKWGRHFRISPEFKMVIARDEQECDALERFAHREDTLFILENKNGPLGVLKGINPPAAILKTAAGLLIRYSKYRNEPEVGVQYWQSTDVNLKHTISSQALSEDLIEHMKI